MCVEVFVPLHLYSFTPPGQRSKALSPPNEEPRSYGELLAGGSDGPDSHRCKSITYIIMVYVLYQFICHVTSPVVHYSHVQSNGVSTFGRFEQTRHLFERTHGTCLVSISRAIRELCFLLSSDYSGWVALGCRPLPAPASCYLFLLPSSPSYSCTLDFPVPRVLQVQTYRKGGLGDDAQRAIPRGNPRTRFSQDRWRGGKNGLGQTRRCAPWVTGFSGKPAYREMRGFAGRKKQPQCGALGTANQQLAS